MTILKPNSRFLKRAFDIIFALFFLIILSPFILILALLIKKDGGPAFYGHERIGQNGIRFKCLKFRSMAVNSQELLQQILNNNPEARQEWETTFKLKNDPRITTIGHFIRKTSLDEIPQLINILKGEMSTVGPRPVTEKELPMYNEDVKYYLMIKPGLTGLWQVSGRNDIDYESRVKLDTNYIQNWSFFKDIIIILKTVKVVLKKDGAY
ncbi:exopolysaccharide biosynthesis polyprenyl glycosylphosphotransferase [Acinetobacter sp. YH12128]|uniref:exopolysaccharide biosynthesis polyprenyl glycosylphosphotransferase n=1 Tax=Acinetobacter sp. YH12128 TaxID=2601113 RepID=UPI0015D23EF3|nr:exopolysaccharide biosynthesis polyprenyl glycosylphosphotransferase [Acinetobacter sp. YH12128]